MYVFLVGEEALFVYLDVHVESTSGQSVYRGVNAVVMSLVKNVYKYCDRTVILIKAEYPVPKLAEK